MSRTKYWLVTFNDVAEYKVFSKKTGWYEDLIETAPSSLHPPRGF